MNNLWCSNLLSAALKSDSPAQYSSFFEIDISTFFYSMITHQNLTIITLLESAKLTLQLAKLQRNYINKNVAGKRKKSSTHKFLIRTPGALVGLVSQSDQKRSGPEVIIGYTHKFKVF